MSEFDPGEKIPQSVWRRLSMPSLDRDALPSPSSPFGHLYAIRWSGDPPTRTRFLSHWIDAAYTLQERLASMKFIAGQKQSILPLPGWVLRMDDDSEEFRRLAWEGDYFSTRVSLWLIAPLSDWLDANPPLLIPL